MNIPATMKAARFYEINRPLVVEEIPVPSIRDDEVLVQVKAVGLCGSDIHIVYEGVTPTAFQPITLGHEPAGIVVKAGSEVQSWKPGTRVSVAPGIFCGTCANCISGHIEICLNKKVLGIQRDGALAQFLAVPAKNLVRLPDNVPFEVGAIITDAVATPFHALIDRAALRPGESIVIYGAGGLGLHAVQISKMAGASRIMVVDTRDEQLIRAKELGADIIINPLHQDAVSTVLSATNGLGADIAAEFIGLQQTISLAVESVIKGGRIVVAGLGPDPISILPPTIFVRKQLSLLGSYGLTRRTIEQLVDLVANGRLDLTRSITHTFSLNQVNTALQYLHEKIENPIRVVVAL